LSSVYTEIEFGAAATATHEATDTTSSNAVLMLPRFVFPLSRENLAVEDSRFHVHPQSMAAFPFKVMTAVKSKAVGTFDQA